MHFRAGGTDQVGTAVVQAGSLTIQTVGIDSSFSIGSFAIQLTVTTSPNSVSTSELPGQPTIARVGSVVGVPSVAQTGNPIITTQAATIHPISISSSVVVGSSRISLAITFVRVEANEPVLLFGAQDPVLGYEAEPKLLWEASL